MILVIGYFRYSFINVPSQGLNAKFTKSIQPVMTRRNHIRVVSDSQIDSDLLISISLASLFTCLI